MVKVHATYELLDLTGTTGVGTALSFKNTERADVQVDYVATTTGTASTIVVEGTVAETSTGSYVTINSADKYASESYIVEVNKPYTYVRAKCTAIATTGDTVAANIITQGEGY